MHDPSGAARGFTLIELLIVVAIILTIAAIAIPNLQAALEQARVARAVGDIHTIGNEIYMYDATNSSFPNSLADIGFGGRMDPWGHPYQYLNFANVKGKGQMRKDRFLVPINSSFDLYSMGKTVRVSHRLPRNRAATTSSGPAMAVSSDGRQTSEHV